MSEVPKDHSLQHLGRKKGGTAKEAGGGRTVEQGIRFQVGICFKTEQSSRKRL